MHILRYMPFVLVAALGSGESRAQISPFANLPPDVAAMLAAAQPPNPMSGMITAKDILRNTLPPGVPLPEDVLRQTSTRMDPMASIQTADQHAVYDNMNRLTSLNGQAFTYDGNGNLLNDGEHTYAWDAENRLIEIDYADAPGKKTTFVYDGLGRRASKTSTPAGGGASTTTDYIWCGDTICASVDTATGAMREYLGEGEYDVQTDTKIYYGVDNLGSVRRAFTSTGASPATDYDPYGNPTSSDAPITDYGYAGLMRDPDSGLYLSVTRAYDPVAGRWLSRDSAGEDTNLGGNLYGYADQDPINFIDPSGLCGCPPHPILNFIGHVNAFPLTLVGGTIGTAGILAGWYEGTRPSVHVANNAVQFWNVPFVYAGFTLGNSTVYGRENPGNTGIYPSYTGRVDLARHEEGHTVQSQILGPVGYAAVNLWYGIGKSTNPLERGADAYSRGTSCAGF